ncbi:MAG: zinc protease [Verrucomicrobiales bacterium]|jgi:zinc protease
MQVPAHEPVIETLPNGLQTIIKPDPQAPVVSVQIWVRTGSVHEEKWLGGGISHLLEHMLFNGTERRKSKEISAEIQAIGGYVNAYTSFDRTVYWIESPPDGFATAVDVLGDMALHSILPEDEFNKELDVIRREMAMGDDSPGQLCSKLLFRTAFQTHPCQHPVIGHREVFDQITHADLLAYYRQHYTPNNMFVVVSGCVKLKKAQQLLAKAFGSTPRQPQPPVLVPAEPRQQGRRVSHLEGQTQLTHLRLAWQAPNVADADTNALDLFSTILGSGRSSRLFQKVREELGLTHSISAFFYSMADAGLFVVGAEVEPEKREAAEAAILEVIRQALAEPVSDAELSKALKTTLSESLSQLTTTRGVASDIGSSWLLTGNADFTRDYVASIQNETPESILAAARRWLNPDNVTVVSLNPEGSQKARTKSARKSKESGTKRIELDNGLTLLVRPDSRLPLVTVHCAFLGGLLAETAKTNGITRMFSRLLTRDTKTRSVAEVADLIESVGGDFSGFSGFNSFGLTAEVMKPDWRTGLEVLAKGLTEPAFAESTLERERQFHLASIRSELDRPMSIAGQRMREAIFGKHAYRLPLLGVEETVNAIKPAGLSKFLGQNVLGTNGVLSVYGDVDASAIRDAVEQLLGGIPRGERRFADLAQTKPIKRSKRIEESHDKEQAIILLAYPTEGLSSDDTLPFELIDEACSDMSGRLYGKIREELGAAYMVGTSRVLGLAGGAFYFYVATSNEQVGIVEEALRSEIAHLAENGLNQAEFDSAKRAWHGSHINRLQSLGARARVNTLDELYGFGWENCDATPAKMDAITRKKVREVAARHFLDQPDVFVCLSNSTQP